MAMDDLRCLLFEKGRVSKVLDILKKQGYPDPETEPERSLVLGHALNLYGDYNRALRIFDAVPHHPSWEAERLWGQSGYHLRIGALHQAKKILDRALSLNPPAWLLPNIYNHLATYYNHLGRFADSIQVSEKGMAIAEKNGYLVQYLILRGNLGIIKAIQGHVDQGLTILEATVKQLLERDSVLAAAHFLIVESELLSSLGMLAEARRCLQRAEKLVERSGSSGRMVFLKVELGTLYGREGQIQKELQAYRQALDILRELPDPLMESQIYSNLAMVHFRRGNLSEALAIIERLLTNAALKSLKPQMLSFLSIKGYLLIGAGAHRQGLEILTQALENAVRLGIPQYQIIIMLYLSRGYLKAGHRDLALEWLKRSLGTAREYNMSSQLLDAKDDLTELLINFYDRIDMEPGLGRLIVSLGHPGLVAKLIRHHHSEGKLTFLRSLNVNNAIAYRSQVQKLLGDRSPEVRRLARSLIEGWHSRSTYRISTFGSLRIFLEDRLLSEDVWGRAGVRRLFLLLLANRGRWLSNEYIQECLWQEPDPLASRRVLASRLSELRHILEPWHPPGKPYLLIQTRRGACGLFGADRLWLDCEEFPRLIKEAEAHYLKRCFREARKAYRQALDLYVGDFLEEYPYEDWLVQKRESIKEIYLRSTIRYAVLEKEGGESIRGPAGPGGSSLPGYLLRRVPKASFGGAGQSRPGLPGQGLGRAPCRLSEEGIRLSTRSRGGRVHC